MNAAAGHPRGVDEPRLRCGEARTRKDERRRRRPLCVALRTVKRSNAKLDVRSAAGARQRTAEPRPGLVVLAASLGVLRFAMPAVRARDGLRRRAHRAAPRGDVLLHLPTMLNDRSRRVHRPIVLVSRTFQQHGTREFWRSHYTARDRYDRTYLTTAVSFAKVAQNDGSYCDFARARR